MSCKAAVGRTVQRKHINTTRVTLPPACYTALRPVLLCLMVVHAATAFAQHCTAGVLLVAGTAQRICSSCCWLYGLCRRWCVCYHPSRMCVSVAASGVCRCAWHCLSVGVGDSVRARRYTATWCLGASGVCSVVLISMKRRCA